MEQNEARHSAARGQHGRVRAQEDGRTAEALCCMGPISWAVKVLKVCKQRQSTACPRGGAQQHQPQPTDATMTLGQEASRSFCGAGIGARMGHGWRERMLKLGTRDFPL